MDDHFDIGRVFEIGKFDITRLTCIKFCENLPICSQDIERKQNFGVNKGP